jgi:AraC-like DNA-binding protein
MPFVHIRSAALTNYAAVARSLGLDPYRELRAAGLDPRSLADPDLRIPVLRVHALLESSAHAAGVDDFGLRMAMSRRLSNLGLIALAAREEPTVRDAVRCLQRTIHLHNEALRIEIEESGEVAVLREHILARVRGPARQSVELAIGVLYRVLQEFLGESWSPTSVSFMHAAPRDVASYRKAFRCPVQFDGVVNGVVCRRRDLDRPMPGADPESLRTARQIVSAAGEHRDTHAERTTLLVLSLLPGGRCTADLVARYLDVDRRTLHRRLAAEGTSFKALVDEVRMEAAQRHLANPRQGIADLASMLGFSGGSTFSRWFVGRFAEPPRRWRRRAG